jgi:hypothetical protein
MERLKELLYKAAKCFKLNGDGKILSRICEDARKIGATGIQVAFAAWIVMDDQVTKAEAFSLFALFAIIYAIGVIGSDEED